MECTTPSCGGSSPAGEARFTVTIDATKGRCPSGERHGDECLSRRAVPVLSCEGACVRGEIARTAANILSKKEGYARGCHGELLTVPDSAIANWIRNSETVVVIDGCFLKCHERIFRNILDETKIRSFDALSYYRKYTEFFHVDDVPEAERNAIAADIAEKIHSGLRSGNKKEDTACTACV